ncbi:hypothetical protein CsSME_00039549 [Camellia sinensis var. sinensis]
MPHSLSFYNSCQQLQHFSHEHPLIFTEEYGKDYVDDDNDNEVQCKGCSVCNFDNDIICAQKPQIIKHTSHKHPMTPLLRTMLFSCDACGLEHEDMSYLCHTCQFWIHESCASLPNTVKHFDHDHPLTLCYSFPREFDNFVFCCDICSEYLDKACWIYSCVGCRCYGHLNCAIAATAASQEEQFRDQEAEIELQDIEISPIPFPVTNESVNLIAYFLNLG